MISTRRFYRDTTFSFIVFERFKEAHFLVANVFTFVLFCRINLKLLYVLTVENNIRPENSALVNKELCCF